MRYNRVRIVADECPIYGEKSDCDNCRFAKYIGTFGGEFYVDCNYDTQKLDRENNCG